jgi:hypothetical protein
MAKPFPKKLTPTSCRCAGKGTCAVCKAKKAKKAMGGMPFGKARK